MAKPKSNTKELTFYVAPDMDTRLRRLAKAYNKPVSWVVRVLLERALIARMDGMLNDPNLDDYTNLMAFITRDTPEATSAYKATVRYS